MKNHPHQNNITSAHLLVSGVVQGVGFRKFTQDRAVHLQLSGTVRNLPDGRVELHVQGEQQNIETLISNLKQGPPRAKVSKVEISWGTALSDDGPFSITG